MLLQWGCAAMSDALLVSMLMQWGCAAVSKAVSSQHANAVGLRSNARRCHNVQSSMLAGPRARLAASTILPRSSRSRQSPYMRRCLQLQCPPRTAQLPALAASSTPQLTSWQPQSSAWARIGQLGWLATSAAMAGLSFAAAPVHACSTSNTSNLTVKLPTASFFQMSSSALL